jgi:uncharacterized surface protein with fasciclin (FAS1) repeats
MSDIVETAVANGSFKTLVSAVGAAGLAETLKGKGPFTVFAPTDAAFAKLPAGTVESLVKPENKAKLAGILSYHVIEGKEMAADAMKLHTAKTVNGQSAALSAHEGKLNFDKSGVTSTDIVCDNGVIHVLDAVAMPK